MKEKLKSGVLALVAVVCLLPASGRASTIFSFSGAPPWSGSSVTSSGATIDFNTLKFGSTTITDTFQEVYSNSTGTLTIVAVDAAGGFTADETLLTISESTNLLPNTSPNAVSLYSGVTALTFASNFATDLGMATTTPTVSSVTLQTMGVTASSGVVSSATASLQVPTAIPEPSSLAMFGMALIAGAGFSVRRRLSLSFVRK
jgi:hypothetical protein